MRWLRPGAVVGFAVVMPELDLYIIASLRRLMMLSPAVFVDELFVLRPFTAWFCTHLAGEVFREAFPITLRSHQAVLFAMVLSPTRKTVTFFIGQ